MRITITNISDSTLILSAPTSSVFVAVSDWSTHAVAPGGSAFATAILPDTGYIGGNLYFNHNLHPSDFTITAAFEYYELVANGSIQNLRLNETFGIVANDTSPENNDGSYNINVVLSAAQSPVSSDRMPQFAGNGFVNLYSANLAADFNPALGSVCFFLQADDIAVWSDPTYMQLLRLWSDGNNRIDIYKNTSPTDQVIYTYIANGVTVTGIADIAHTLNPYHIALTWNYAQDRVRAYLNGIQMGSDLTGIGLWSGALDPLLTVLGGESVFASLGWYGYLSQERIYNRELTADEINTLSLS